ncbi:hypothetical protein J8847_18145, partial [Massilia sp. AB1]|nr:hypothetical protein [Massilia sp. AB1]
MSDHLFTSSAPARAAAAMLPLLLAGCMSFGPQGERAQLRDAAGVPSGRAIAALAAPEAAWPAQD